MGTRWIALIRTTGILLLLPSALLAQEGDGGGEAGAGAPSFEQLVERAGAAYEEGAYARAEQLYRSALEEDPENAAIYYNLGNIYYDRREYGRAIAAYENAVDAGGDDLRLHYNLGNAYYENQNFDAALESYRRARAAGDGEGPDGALTVNTAKTLMQLDQQEEARTLLAAFLEENPQASRAAFQLGNILYDAGEYEGAAVRFARAVELEPELVRGYFNLGNALYRLEEYREAADAFSRVVERRPEDRDALYNLGLSYISLAERLGTPEEE